MISLLINIKTSDKPKSPCVFYKSLFHTSFIFFSSICWKMRRNIVNIKQRKQAESSQRHVESDGPR